MASGREKFNWNEYQWAQEIRRDERRISCYFHELPYCLDLPGEEDMIFENLFSQVDLVPVNGKSDSLRSWESDDDGEWEDSRPPHRLAVELDKLAVDWNAVLALIPGGGLKGLGVSCLFGKLIARVSDFLDPDLIDLPLKRSLGKHAVLDLNELAGVLKRFAGKECALQSFIHSQLEILGHIRENLLSELDNHESPS